MPHSPACTAEWKPSRKCHCSVCCENFSTPANFDKHWTKNGHAHPSTVGLVQNGRGIWTMPGEVDIRERLEKAQNG